MSGQFAFRNAERSNAAPPEQRAFEDAIARATLSPGIAPWAGARAGLGERFEAGLAYTGRSVRADARRAFGGDSVAVSVGAAASAVFSETNDGSDGPSPSMTSGRLSPTVADVRANGYGFVEGWLGARGGVEHVGGDLPLAPGGEEPPGKASFGATRWYGGGLVGAALGLSPITVAVELDVAYQSVTGTASFPAEAGPPGRRDGSASGLTLSPAGAIIGKF